MQTEEKTSDYNSIHPFDYYKQHGKYDKRETNQHICRKNIINTE